MSYINISGTFYHLCSILDGCSRYIVNLALRESMTEADIEIILQRANAPWFGLDRDFPEAMRMRSGIFSPQFSDCEHRECAEHGQLLWQMSKSHSGGRP